MNSIDIHTGTGFFESPPILFSLLRDYATLSDWWPEKMEVNVRGITEDQTFRFQAGILRLQGRETMAEAPEIVCWKFDGGNFRGYWQWTIAPGDNGAAMDVDISGKVTGIPQVMLSPVISYEKLLLSASRQIMEAMQTVLARRRNDASQENG